MPMTYNEYIENKKENKKLLDKIDFISYFKMAVETNCNFDELMFIISRNEENEKLFEYYDEESFYLYLKNRYGNKIKFSVWEETHFDILGVDEE